MVRLAMIYFCRRSPLGSELRLTLLPQVSSPKFQRRRSGSDGSENGSPTKSPPVSRQRRISNNLPRPALLKRNSSNQPVKAPAASTPPLSASSQANKAGFFQHPQMSASSLSVASTSYAPDPRELGPAVRKGVDPSSEYTLHEKCVTRT